MVCFWQISVVGLTSDMTDLIISQTCACKVNLRHINLVYRPLHKAIWLLGGLSWLLYWIVCAIWLILLVWFHEMQWKTDFRIFLCSSFVWIFPLFCGVKQNHKSNKNLYKKFKMPQTFSTLKKLKLKLSFVVCLEFLFFRCYQLKRQRKHGSSSTRFRF